MKPPRIATPRPCPPCETHSAAPHGAAYRGRAPASSSQPSPLRQGRFQRHKAASLSLGTAVRAVRLGGRMFYSPGTDHIQPCAAVSALNLLLPDDRLLLLYRPRSVNSNTCFFLREPDIPNGLGLS